MRTVKKQLAALERDCPKLCPSCQRIEAMTEEELDAELTRLMDIIAERGET
jgi:hypothetical protein